jgi:hypothetical protein
MKKDEKTSLDQVRNDFQRWCWYGVAILMFVLMLKACS